MIISIEEARQLMGEANKKYSDQYIEDVINIFDFLADMSIDCFLVKREKRVDSNKQINTLEINENDRKEVINNGN